MTLASETILALDDVGKSVDTLKQKVDGRFDQMKVEIFEEIDKKTSC